MSLKKIKTHPAYKINTYDPNLNVETISSSTAGDEMQNDQQHQNVQEYSQYTGRT